MPSGGPSQFSSIARGGLLGIGNTADHGRRQLLLCFLVMITNALSIPCLSIGFPHSTSYLVYSLLLQKPAPSFDLWLPTPSSSSLQDLLKSIQLLSFVPSSLFCPPTYLHPRLTMRPVCSAATITMNLLILTQLLLVVTTGLAGVVAPNKRDAMS